jgi:CheY-like chemotaxis protein
VVIPVDLTGLPILIVDDNATNRRVLADTLRLWGAQPAAAATVPEAWQLLWKSRQDNTRFAAILLDAMMPDTDGFQLAAALRQEPAFADIPILLLTSADRPGDLVRCRELGITSYLLKPVKASELNQALAQALSRPQSPASRFARPTNPDKADQESDGKPALSSPPAPISTSAPRRSWRILLVEDNPVNQHVAVRTLERMGHVVTVVSNGRAAVEHWQQGQYDVILMDIQMPELDGFEATKLIRQLEANRACRTPIIAMTAHAMKGDRERCLAAGMDDYVAKPVRREELEAALDRVLAQTPMVVETPHPVATPSPLLDRAAALERLGGDAALLAELVSLFQQDAPRLLSDLHAALNQQDAEALRRAAHSLKGAAAYIGATAISETAYRLERLAANGQLAEASRTLQELEQALSALQAVLQQSALDHAPPADAARSSRTSHPEVGVMSQPTHSHQPGVGFS